LTVCAEKIDEVSMPTIDLKPIAPEAIEELGPGLHDLWEVKMGEEVYGPFESAPLYSFIQENPKLMSQGFLKHWGTEKWDLFYHFEEFASFAPEPTKTFIGNYWVMVQGQKHGPLNQEQIENKIRQGQYLWSSDFSEDEGVTWIKLSESKTFSPLFSAKKELPPLPKEGSFQKSRATVSHKLEKKKERIYASNPLSDLAEAAHTNKVALKLEELTLTAGKEIPVARSFKWALPLAGSFVAVFIVVGSLLSQSKSENPLEVYPDEDAPSAQVAKATPPKRNPAVIPKSPPSSREMASVPKFERSNLTAQPDYSTHVEVHNAEDYDPDYGLDLRDREIPRDVAETEQRYQEEIPSLVDNAYPPEESLDGTMNNISQAPPQNDPIVLDQPAMEPEYPSDYPAEPAIPEEVHNY
jgi:hypothetical protein